MTARLVQLIPADGWYAVFARIGGGRDLASGTGGKPPRVNASNRLGAALPEFLPLIAWGLVVDDAGREPGYVLGLVANDAQQPEAVLVDDPSFLGYAGPGDPSIPSNRSGLAPDWQALAKRAISELRPPNEPR